MLNILSEYSIDFKKLIHEVLEIVMDFFIEIGGNLNFDEIYAEVFPLHLRDNEEFIKKHFKKLYMHIIDDFNHSLTALDEYVLYGILSFVYDGTDDGFPIDDIISEKLQSNKFNKLNDEELRWLNSIHDVGCLIGICFEDIDFLDVGIFIEWFKNRPDLLEKYAHIDLDYYKEIMPEDILEEYNQIKKSRKENKKADVIIGDLEISDEEEFFDIVFNAVKEFNNAIVHKKLHRLLINEHRQADEKDVQILFNLIANSVLKPYNIVALPEVDTGRGTVDFYISQGLKYRALIEFKLASSTQKKDGLQYQLPLYLIVEDIDFGIFVLICYDTKSYDGAYKLYDIANEVSKKINKIIKFVRINASGDSKTASKIRCEEEFQLEDWRNINDI